MEPTQPATSIPPLPILVKVIAAFYIIDGLYNISFTITTGFSIFTGTTTTNAIVMLLTAIVPIIEGGLEAVGVIAGIGLLRRWVWARSLAVLVAFLYISQTVFAFVLFFMWVPSFDALDLSSWIVGIITVIIFGASAVYLFLAKGVRQTFALKGEDYVTKVPLLGRIIATFYIFGGAFLLFGIEEVLIAPSILFAYAFGDIYAILWQLVLPGLLSGILAIISGFTLLKRVSWSRPLAMIASVAIALYLGLEQLLDSWMYISIALQIILWASAAYLLLSKDVKQAFSRSPTHQVS